MQPDEKLRKAVQQFKSQQEPRDYDMDAYIRKYGQPDQSKGQHLTDEFKLPNHITFSSDSVYSTPEKKGGDWKEEAGKWHFYASAHNLKEHSAEELRDYFRRKEPDAVLHLPGGSTNE